jgi:hypothetical protein
MLGLTVAEGIEGTGTTRDIITTTRRHQDIITDGKRAKGIRTGTGTIIAGSIVTVTGITGGIVIAIEDTIIGIGTIGIGTTKGDISTSV